MGKIIAVATPKGGVGKTTTAFNLSYAFALNGKKTLLIDADPSGSCSSIFNDLNFKGGIFDIFNYTKLLKQIIHQTNQKNLSFIPFVNLSFHDETRLTKLTSSLLLFRNQLRPEANSYDYIIIDCPPYLVGMTTNSLIAADSVIIPIQPSPFSLKSIGKMVDHIELIKRNYNRHLSIEGILLTFNEKNSTASFKAKKNLILMYPNHILRTIIPKNTDITNAFFTNQSVISYNVTAKSSLAYMRLAQELLEKNQTGLRTINQQLNEINNKLF
jgi:chromosome partitioning protein